MIKRFFGWNIGLANKIEGWLPANFTRSLLYRHELETARIMNSVTDQRIVDVGGGHLCPFARHRQSDKRTQIVAVDILHSQVARNDAVDIGVVGDACRGIPLRAETADMIVTRSVMEHLPDTETFVREMSRVLKVGGRAVHVFPSRFAPFAILNQLLPNRLTKWLIDYVFPEWSDECGFKTHYDNCYYPRVIQLFEGNGFEIETAEYRYYQSIYFKFFVPLYLLSVLYDLLIWSLGLKVLCCQIFVVARRTD